MALTCRFDMLMKMTALDESRPLQVLECNYLNGYFVYKHSVPYNLSGTEATGTLGEFAEGYYYDWYY